MNASPFVTLNPHALVILNLFQDPLRQRAKPDEVLKQVQDDDSPVQADDIAFRHDNIFIRPAS